MSDSLWPHTAAPQAFLSFTIFQSLLKLMSIVSMMPSNYLILCCPLLLLPSVFPSIRVFSNELALHNKWPKCCSFSFSISPSNEYSELTSSFALCLYFMSPLRNCDLLKGKDHSLCIFLYLILMNTVGTQYIMMMISYICIVLVLC